MSEAYLTPSRLCFLHVPHIHVTTHTSYRQCFAHLVMSMHMLLRTGSGAIKIYKLVKSQNNQFLHSESSALRAS
jgi:predicted RNase H-related nuclease YkuK (DUF458 family)